MREITIYKVYKENYGSNKMNNITETEVVFADALNAINYTAVKNREERNFEERYFYIPSTVKVYENAKEALRSEKTNSNELTLN